MSIEVVPSRTPNDRFDRFKVVYGDMLDLNGYSVPVTLACSVNADSLVKLRAKLEQCLSESIVSEYYPNGVADAYCTEIKKIDFSFKCLPVADLQVMLPLIWSSFKTALETSDLNYHIPGCEFVECDGRVFYTSDRGVTIRYNAEHDLFDVLDCILKNFTKGAVIVDKWVFRCHEFNTIQISDGSYEHNGFFDTVDVVRTLYNIYKGNF